MGAHTELQLRFAGLKSNMLVSILLSIILLGISAHWFWSWWRLRHIPGPPLASFSLLWILRKALSGRYQEELKTVSDQYGPLARIGPNELLCTDPEVIKRMSAVRSTYTKGVFYKAGKVVPGEETLVSLRDEVQHKELRTKMTPAVLLLFILLEQMPHAKTCL